MFISDFRRIDTTSFPGVFLSTVEISPGEGYGYNEAEVANIVHSDRESIDGVMFRGKGADILDFEGVHKLIRTIRPSHTMVMIETRGERTEVLDDLVGAGYINMVGFILDKNIDKNQKASMKLVRESGCPFGVKMILSPEGLTMADAQDMKEDIAGAGIVTLNRPEQMPGKKRYKKNELVSLAKSLKESAKDVKVF